MTVQFINITYLLSSIPEAFSSAVLFSLRGASLTQRLKQLKNEFRSLVYFLFLNVHSNVASGVASSMIIMEANCSVIHNLNLMLQQNVCFSPSLAQLTDVHILEGLIDVF